MIRKVLELSTGHLPEKLGEPGGLSKVDGVVADELTYGWLMWVPEDPDHPLVAEFPPPPVVLNIQRYARAHGCDYVRFDPDVHAIADLPRWRW